MNDPQEFGRRVVEEPDFIALKRFDYSLARLKERYPEEAPNNVIADALLMNEEGVEEVYQSAVKNLRRLMKVEV